MLPSLLLACSVPRLRAALDGLACVPSGWRLDEERGVGAVESGQGRRDGAEPPEARRRFGASRVRPRVEFGRTPPPRAEDAQPFEPPGERLSPAEPVDSPFGRPREFAGGRLRVYGFSPGCLVASLLISLVLSCLLTALVNGF